MVSTVMYNMHVFGIKDTIKSFIFCLFSSPSLFDLDTISSSDATTRLTHAFKVATNTYGVPPLFDPEGRKLSCAKLLKC